MTPAPPSTARSTRATPPTQRNPWAWVPTLYLAEGLPYVVVMTVSVIMYKGMGISNSDIALYTSWLYLPWVIKPLWSPVVDILKTRRLWIWVMQLIVGAGLAGVALTLRGPNFFGYSLAFLVLLAFSSATHDIAADGFYMLATTEREQAFFVGIRSTFYRISMISGQGLLVILAGFIQSHTGLPNVELTISARPNAALVEAISPGRFESPPGERLEIVAEPVSLAINPEPRTTEEVNRLIAAAKASNATNGFYASQPATLAREDSGWSRYVSHPFKTACAYIGRLISSPFRAIGDWLEPRLRARFGPQGRAAAAQGTTPAAGSVGVAYLRMSRPPGKAVTVTLAQAPGGMFGFFKTAAKSVSIAEGARLIFNDQNWNQPAAVVFQLDPRQRGELSAIYQVRSGDIPWSWAITFGVLAGLFLFFGIYHKVMLPRPEKDRPGTAQNVAAFLAEFFRTFAAFFTKDRIGVLLLFLLFYRFAEAQLVKMVAPFLLDGREAGGLGLSTGQVGFVYGTIGIIALTCGGLLGGMLVSRQGLKFWLWPMVLIMHLPDAAFVYLAYAQPQSFTLINLCVALEQFGYGFGFTAYMLYMIHIARGRHETAHYAICTGFMALGMMIPGMFSGWLQEIIGYSHFFVWVMLATLPGFLVVAFIPLEAAFGRKGET